MLICEPTKEDLFAVMVKVGLNEKEAVEIFEEIQGILSMTFDQSF